MPIYQKLYEKRFIKDKTSSIIESETQLVLNA